MKISVCIATYNGAKYIGEQLDSILLQLHKDDEVIIIDDGSSDNTVALIQSYNDCRVKLYINEENRGVNYSFEKAISLSQGNYIFLSDQDDIWSVGRVEIMLSSLIKSDSLLVSSNFTSIDSEGNSFPGYANCVKSVDSNRNFKNLVDIYIGKLNYFGCTMAFSADLKKIILPFPILTESHDLLIALASNIMQSNVHVDNVTLYHRVHGKNLSIVNRPIYRKIWSRVVFSISIVIIVKRFFFGKCIK